MSYYQECLKQPLSKNDLFVGLTVGLIALPLSMGIAAASGCPPVAGLLAAIVGGIVTGFVGGAPLTIKGPAAGLIVIVLGAVQELSPDLQQGYRLALAVGVVAGMLQLLMGALRLGKLSNYIPSTVIHGMLAGIGIIIISKQSHILLGVVPHSKQPGALLLEIPDSIPQLNPIVAIIGLLSFCVMVFTPVLKARSLQKLPAPMIAVALALLVGEIFNISVEHDYQMLGKSFHIGSQSLIHVPDSILAAITFPDWSGITTVEFWKYVMLFSLVGSVESLLTVQAADRLSERSSDSNRDLMALGVGNIVSALIGGLPMISEVVRTKANIDGGAKSHWSNVSHGLFILVATVLISPLLNHIPSSALAGVLIYIGFRLASPREFLDVLKVGPEQFVIFLVTAILCVFDDLLVGVGVGMVLSLMLNGLVGRTLRHLFVPKVRISENRGAVQIAMHSVAVFSNYPRVERMLTEKLSSDMKVELDLSRVRIIDHAFREKLHHLASSYPELLSVKGLERHRPVSRHPLATLIRKGDGGVSRAWEEVN